MTAETIGLPADTAPHPRTPGRTRIAILDDHLLFSESLEIALRMEGHDARRVPFSTDSATIEGLVSAVLRVGPRIVLLDLDLGAAGNGTRLIAPLVRAGVIVVVVTCAPERARWGECLALGARVVVDKSGPLNTVLATVRRVTERRPVITREERDALIATFLSESRDVRDARDRLDALTLRERQILGQLMAGRTVRDIAHQSVVSESTVRTQVKSILGKLEVSSQIGAVGTALRARWRPPPQRQSRDIPDLRHAAIGREFLD